MAAVEEAASLVASVAMGEGSSHRGDRLRFCLPEIAFLGLVCRHPAAMGRVMCTANLLTGACCWCIVPSPPPPALQHCVTAVRLTERYQGDALDGAAAAGCAAVVCAPVLRAGQPSSHSGALHLLLGPSSDFTELAASHVKQAMLLAHHMAQRADELQRCAAAAASAAVAGAHWPSWALAPRPGELPSVPEEEDEDDDGGDNGQHSAEPLPWPLEDCGPADARHRPPSRAGQG